MRAVIVSATLSLALAANLAANPDSAARFDGLRLRRPGGYREWMFLGSSLGLGYSQVAGPASTGADLYHNVYIEPRAYRQFQRTGIFPEGTMLVMELAREEAKQEPGLHGSYQKEFVGLEASVKDRSRFKEGWGYFLFASGSRSAEPAAAQPAASCWQCHHEHAATDHVFTQFYPVLRR
jgi:hypothetical protein